MTGAGRRWVGQGTGQGTAVKPARHKQASSGHGFLHRHLLGGKRTSQHLYRVSGQPMMFSCLAGTMIYWLVTHR